MANYMFMYANDDSNGDYVPVVRLGRNATYVCGDQSKTDTENDADACEHAYELSMDFCSDDVVAAFKIDGSTITRLKGYRGTKEC